MPTFKNVYAGAAVQAPDVAGSFIRGQAASMAYRNAKQEEAIAKERATAMAYQNTPEQRAMRERSQEVDNFYKEALGISALRPAGEDPTKVYPGEDQFYAFDEGAGQMRGLGGSPKRGARTSISVKGDNQAQENVANRVETDFQEARQDAQSIGVIDRGLRTLRTSDVTSGVFGDMRLFLGKLLYQSGFTDGEDAVATEEYLSQMGNLVGQVIKQFGSGTGLSDADREYAQKISGGDINLTPKSMERILEINRKMSAARIQRFNDQISNMSEKGNRAQKDIAQYYSPISIPSGRRTWDPVKKAWVDG